MPRQRSETATPVDSSTAMVASAARYPGKAARIYIPNQDWQRECYRHYGICGEARFAAKFFGNAVSRAVLKTAHMEKGVIIEESEGPAFDALGDLFNGAQGQTGMLESIGIHLTIAGECYLVGREVEKVDTWEIVSVIEMRVTGSGENAQWSIDYADGRPPVDLDDKAVVIRLWLPHPARQMEADSPFRSLLPILSEIEWLTRHVFSQISSRLAGAGILLLPQGLSFPPPTDKDGKVVETTNEADSFMLTLAEAMMRPLEDPGSPSALVPIVITAPDDAIDKAKLLQFWSNLDENSMALRGEGIRRFALGMDMPPEQVLGMSSNSGTGGGTSNGISHWGAWQVEEATIKMHVEPMLDVICAGITLQYLHPLIEPNVESFIIYDTSALRLRPDRSKEAMELYDRGLVSAVTVRRENGFDDDDAPDDEEWKRWMLVKVINGTPTPEQVTAALGMLGITLPVVTPVTTAPPAPRALPAPGDSDPDTPSLLDHPTRPRTPEAAKVLLAAAEPLVFRALERAGNRIRQAHNVKPPGVPAYEMHTLFAANGSSAKFLEDAWSCAPQVLDGIADAEKVIPLLDSYCLSLMAEQAPHDRTRLASWLTRLEA